MIEFIAMMIEQQADISIEKGRNKYAAYFIKPKRKIYEPYRAGVDTILLVDGYSDVIITD